MRIDLLLISLLGALTFSLSTALHVAMDRWEGGRRGDGGILEQLLGDSRRMFATHYFVKADAYFHSGYYPSIFDTQDPNRQAHIAEHASGAAEDEEDEKKADFDGPPRDWIDRFGRAFRPNRHRHLDDMDEDGDEAGHEGHEHHHHHGEEETHGQEETGHTAAEKPGSKSLGTVESKGSTPQLAREILPWLRLSASLDPQRVQTYVVGAYFLRNMGRADQAEAFLREGLRENARSYEILTELGKLCLETHKDQDRARNFWVAALRYWKIQQLPRPEEQRDRLTYATLLAHLAKLEEDTARWDKAAEYLAELIPISPSREQLAPRLEAARSKAGATQP